MPYPPYHLGPSTFLGLVFRKRLDVPVFVLANVAVDVEVLVVNAMGIGWPVHRYAHTLLGGAVVGIVWALMAYPLRGVFEWVMKMLQLPYRVSLWKMIFSGILGAWVHVVFDAFYHWDVKIFWPSKVMPLYRLLNKSQVNLICIGFWAAAVVLYVIILVVKARGRRSEKDSGGSA